LVLAIFASALLFLYLFLPYIWFRANFGFYVPLRNFARTQIEEIFQSIAVAILPLVFAWVLVWFVPPFDAWPWGVSGTWAERRQDYKTVVAGVSIEREYEKSQKPFWDALTRSSRRQLHFLFWYYIFITAEGNFFGILAILYPRKERNWFYSFFAKRFLFNSISEWYFLLSPTSYPGKGVVRADVLSDGGVLYQGTIADYSLAREGSLNGLVLAGSRRYDRELHLQDREKGIEKDRETYWRDIPGTKLYLFAGKIQNLNFRREASFVMPDLLTRLLSEKIGAGVAFRATWKLPKKARPH
jgi:hypothetical protein